MGHGTSLIPQFAEASGLGWPWAWRLGRESNGDFRSKFVINVPHLSNEVLYRSQTRDCEFAVFMVPDAVAAEPAAVVEGAGAGRRRERAPAARARRVVLDYLRRGGGFTVGRDGAVHVHGNIFCSMAGMRVKGAADGVAAVRAASGDDSSTLDALSAAMTSRQRRSAARNTRAAFLQRQQKRQQLVAAAAAAAEAAAAGQQRLVMAATTATTATTATKTTTAAISTTAATTTTAARRRVVSVPGKRQAVAVGQSSCDCDEVARARPGAVTRAMAALWRAAAARRGTGEPVGITRTRSKDRRA